MDTIHFPSRDLVETFCPFQNYCSDNDLLIRTAHDVYKLWEAWERECGTVCPVPHWAIVWPAAQVLAEYILDHPETVRGKKVLEIGSGSGLVSIACAKSGAAEVTANDTDPVCLKMSMENAMKNKLDLKTESGNLLVQNILPDYDVILAADFFYLKDDSGKCVSLFNKWSEAGKAVLFADGGRAFAPKQYREILQERIKDVDEAVEGRASVKVRVIQYS